jgi:hypothetical protein
MNKNYFPNRTVYRMNRRQLNRNGKAGSWRILLGAAAVYFASQTAHAGPALQLQPGSFGNVTYSLYNTGPSGSSSPIFNGNMLISPGGVFPALTSVIAGQPVINLPTLATPPVPPAVAAALGGDFGTASTQILAQNTGTQGAETSKGGIFWTNLTNVSDAIPQGKAEASVSFSTAHAVFLNNSGGMIPITSPGAILRASALLGGTGGSYVAAYLTTTITVTNTTNQVVSTFTGSILAAADNAGNIINRAGVGNGSGITVNFDGTNFGVSGTSLAAGMQVQNNFTVTIDAALTLISDPMSFISIVNFDTPGFAGIVPDLGVNVGGFNAIPEPSTIVMLGLGLATAGAWRVRARRRGLAPA